MFNRKKKKIAEIRASFAKVKDEVFDFNMIEKYFNGLDHSKYYHTINDRTCNDLDFDEFFMLADRTQSKVGQQYLYARFRTMEDQPGSFDVQEKVIQFFKDYSEKREQVQYQLSKLSHRDAFHINTLFQEEHLQPPKWFFTIPILSVISLGVAILSFFNSIFILVLVLLFGINFIIHTWNKRNVFYYIKSIPQLIRLNSIAKLLFRTTDEVNDFESAKMATKKLSGLEKRLSIFQVEKNGDDLSIIAWAFIELIKTQFLLEPIFLFRALKKIDLLKNEIHEVFQFVGKIDSFISILSFRDGLSTWNHPNISASSLPFVATDIYHPLIEDCISNSIDTKDRSILLTGSNMSGKTTFIRTIGINVLSSLSINTCFAKTLELRPCKLHSAIRISDDLMNSKSYYFEEVLTIKDMIDQSTDGLNHLFLLDEIFKGTNTIERISAGKAVLNYLKNAQCTVFVSTHDVELTDLLAKEYTSFHFSENIENQSVGFDYQLKTGKLQNRNAIKILEINGYPKSVISEAKSISKKLD